MAEEDLTLNIRLTGGKQAIDELTEILRLRNAVLGGGGAGGGGGRAAPLGGGQAASVGPVNFPQTGGQGGGLVDVSGRPLTGRADPALRQAMRPVAEAVIGQARQAIVEEVQSVAQRQAQSPARQRTAANRAEAAAASSASTTLADQVRQRILAGQVPGLTPEVIERVARGTGAGGGDGDAQSERFRQVVAESFGRLEGQRRLDPFGRLVSRLEASARLGEARQEPSEEALSAVAEPTAQIQTAQEARRTSQERQRAQISLNRQASQETRRAQEALERQRTQAFQQEALVPIRAAERLERQRVVGQTIEARQAARVQQTREQFRASVAEFEDPELTAVRRSLAATRGVRAAGRLGALPVDPTVPPDQRQTGFAAQAALQERLATFRQEQRQAARAGRPQQDQLQEFFGEGPLARFNRAAFGPAIAGLSLQFGLLPAFQANQQVQQAGLQFGAFSPQRAGTQQAITVEMTRLGQGALQAQSEIDRLTLGLLKLANTVPGAGQALAVLGAAGGAATAAFNLAGPVVGAGAALAAARSTGQAAQAARVAAGLEAAPAAISGAAGASAGIGAGGIAAGLGLGALFLGGPLLRAAGLAPEVPEEQRTPFQRNVAQIPAELRRFGRWVAESPTPLGFLLSRLRETAPAQQFAQGAQEITREPPPQPLGPAATTIRARMQTEARRTAGLSPQDIAAEQEVISRAEARIGLQQQRFGMDIAREQFGLQQTQFAEDQAFARRRLGVEFGRTVEDIGIGQGRAIRGVVTSTLRQSRDIGIAETQARTDIRRNERRQREDIGINLAQNIEDINIGAGESREDIDRGFGRGFRNLIFGQIGGLAGGVLGLMFSRQDALEDVETGRGRAIRRAQRGAGRAGAAVGLGARRAGEDVTLGTERAQGALGRSVNDRLEDIGQGAADALEDAGRRFGQASSDLAEVQTIQLRRFQEHVAIQQRVMDFQETQWQRQSDLLRDMTLSYDQLVKRLNEILVSLGGVPERIDRHISRSLAI